MILAVERSVLASGGKPYELWHVVGGDDSRFLTLDNGDCIIGAGPQLMLSEKNTA